MFVIEIEELVWLERHADCSNYSTATVNSECHVSKLQLSVAYLSF